MNNQWMKTKTGLMLLALTLVATAAVSAQQWSLQGNQQSTNRNSVVTTNISDMPEFVLQNHTINLNKYGVLEGRINSTNATENGSELNVYLIRNGKISHQTTTDTDGGFELYRVGEGPYSFVVTGPTGFTAYGVNVSDFREGQDPLNLMEAAPVSPGITGIKQVLYVNFPAEIADEIMQTAATKTPQSREATVVNKVRLVNGSLHGQVTSVASEGQQVPGAIVNLIQNGLRIADVQVDQQGNFQIPDLQPGFYDFIAVGIKGLAAIRFEAVGQNSPMTQIAYRRTPKLIATSLVVALTTKNDTGLVDDSIDYTAAPESYPIYDAPVEYAGDSASFGTAAGGSAGYNGSYPASTAPVRGGGFGGRFGGGRGGRIFGFGALAVGIAALADDNDKGNGGYPPPPPPQSPYGYGYGYGYGN